MASEFAVAHWLCINAVRARCSFEPGPIRIVGVPESLHLMLPRSGSSPFHTGGIGTFHPLSFMKGTRGGAHLFHIHAISISNKTDSHEDPRQLYPTLFTRSYSPLLSGLVLTLKRSIDFLTGRTLLTGLVGTPTRIYTLRTELFQGLVPR